MTELNLVLSNIEDQIRPYMKYNPDINYTSKQSRRHKNIVHIYLLILILSFIIMFISKPKIILTKSIDDENKQDIDVYKYILASMSLFIIISCVLYFRTNIIDTFTFFLHYIK